MPPRPIPPAPIPLRIRLPRAALVAALAAPAFAPALALAAPRAGAVAAATRPDAAAVTPAEGHELTGPILDLLRRREQQVHGLRGRADVRVSAGSWGGPSWLQSAVLAE